MCIKMEVKKIIDTKTMSILTGKDILSVPVTYTIIKLWLDDECVEQQKEKFDKYFHLETWLYATKLLNTEEVVKDMKQIISEEEAKRLMAEEKATDTESLLVGSFLVEPIGIDFQTYQESLFERYEFTIESPFLLWYTLEDYNIIRFQEIMTETDTDKNPAIMTEEEEIDILKLYPPYQALFTTCKDKIKRKVIKSLRQLKKELQYLIMQKKQQEIIIMQEEFIDRLMANTEQMMEITNQAMEQTNQILEMTNQSIDRTTHIMETTKQMIETTRQMIEMTSQMIETTNQIDDGGDR